MDESEKRGRKGVSRRQQPQQQGTFFASPSSGDSVHSLNNAFTRVPPPRPKSRMRDYMAGVAAGLSAVKSNGLVSGGLGQAAAAASVAAAIPRHLDLDFRDRTDASAKRRFQVKVPCRLMAMLALIFLVVPGLFFLHKELHIHDPNNAAHYKSEHYLMADPKEVWKNFRSDVESGDADGDGDNKEEQKIAGGEKQDSNAGIIDATSLKAEDLIAVSKNATKDDLQGGSTNNKGTEEHDDAKDDDLKKIDSDEKHPAHLNSTTLEESNGNTIENNDEAATKSHANTTVANNESSNR